MSASGSIWTTLGVAATRDVALIRRAYATRLRVTRPDDDPEGFQRLRTAYEAALALAEQPQREITTPVPSGEAEREIAAPAPSRESRRAPPPANAPAIETPEEAAVAPAVAQPTAQAAEAAAVRAGFDALWLALRPHSPTDAAALRGLLHRIFELIAGSRLTIQADAENGLARLLADMSPRSDPLLEECAIRFGWEKQETQLSPDPAVLRVLARRRDIATLDGLEAGSDPLANAFTRLRKPANPQLRWLRANVMQAQRWPELKLLARLKDGNPALLRELDAAEVAWWERFQKRPRLSAGILAIGAILLVIVMVGAMLAVVQSGSWHYARTLVLSSLVVFVTLLASKLYLIDWPTFLVTSRWRNRPPPLVGLGWLPLMALTFGVALLLRQSSPMWWATAVVGVLAGLWAIYVSGPMPPALQKSNIVLANSHLAQAFVLNFALGWWWFAAIQEFSPPARTPHDAGSIGAIALMCSGVFGIRALRTAWTYGLTQKQRKAGTLALAACAIILGPVVWLAGASANWRPLVAWLIVTLVVAHRAACGGFNANQIRARVVFLLLGVFIATAMQQSHAAPVTQIGGIVFLAVVLFNLAATYSSQFRAPAATNRR